MKNHHHIEVASYKDESGKRRIGIFAANKPFSKGGEMAMVCSVIGHGLPNLTDAKNTLKGADITHSIGWQADAKKLAEMFATRTPSGQANAVAELAASLGVTLIEEEQAAAVHKALVTLESSAGNNGCLVDVYAVSIDGGTVGHVFAANNNGLVQFKAQMIGGAFVAWDASKDGAVAALVAYCTAPAATHEIRDDSGVIFKGSREECYAHVDSLKVGGLTVDVIGESPIKRATLNDVDRARIEALRIKPEYAPIVERGGKVSGYVFTNADKMPVVAHCDNCSAPLKADEVETCRKCCDEWNGAPASAEHQNEFYNIVQHDHVTPMSGPAQFVVIFGKRTASGQAERGALVVSGAMPRDEAIKLADGLESGCVKSPAIRHAHVYEFIRRFRVSKYIAERNLSARGWNLEYASDAYRNARIAELEHELRGEIPDGSTWEGTEQMDELRALRRGGWHVKRETQNMFKRPADDDRKAVAQNEAIATADAHLNNVALPNYTELRAILADLLRVEELNYDDPHAPATAAIIERARRAVKGE